MEHLDSKAALLETVQALRDELDGVVAEAGAERATRPGGFGEWTLKDVITHITGWRWRTVARLEAGRHGGEPANPWPDHLDEEHDLDEINHWFFETSRDKTLDQVLRESRETFARVERAIAALPERDLLEPGASRGCRTYRSVRPSCAARSNTTTLNTSRKSAPGLTAGERLPGGRHGTPASRICAPCCSRHA